MERFTFPLLSLFLLFTSACAGSPQQDRPGTGQNGHAGQESRDAVQGPGATGPNVASGGERIVMHPVTDPTTGMVSQEVPLPASWTVTSATSTDEPAITGPGGVKVYYWSGGSFQYSNDPYMQQTYRMAGVPMRAPLDIGTYVQQDVAQAMRGKGMRLVDQYPLPHVAESNLAYASKLFKSAPSNDQYWAMGTEWADPNGEPMFMVVNMMVSQGQSSVFWFTNMQALSAEKGAMPSAKAALVNSIVNTRYNPRQIAAYNANEQRKYSQSTARFNARMQDDKRNFEQRQQANRETQDYINKSNMDAYNYRQQVNDGLQHSFNNYLNDENTVRDKGTGERYQVESGANQYWMNNNNEYIPSNDALYNPNLDPNVNDQQWQETEIEP